MNSAIEFWQNLWHIIGGGEDVTTYKDLYYRLFNTLTDAIEELEAGRVVIAIEEMKQAQIRAEEEVLKVDIMPDNP